MPALFEVVGLEQTLWLMLKPWEVFCKDFAATALTEDSTIVYPAIQGKLFSRLYQCCWNGYIT